MKNARRLYTSGNRSFALWRNSVSLFLLSQKYKNTVKELIRKYLIQLDYIRDKKGVIIMFFRVRNMCRVPNYFYAFRVVHFNKWPFSVKKKTLFLFLYAGI